MTKQLYQLAQLIIESPASEFYDLAQQVIKKYRCNHWKLNNQIKVACDEFAEYSSCSYGKVCEKHKCRCPQ